MVLGKFNLPSLGLTTEAPQEFLTNMAAILDLPIPDHLRSNPDSDHVVDMIFFSRAMPTLTRWENLSLSPLSWSDHTLVSLTFSYAASLQIDFRGNWSGGGGTPGRFAGGFAARLAEALKISWIQK